MEKKNVTILYIYIICDFKYFHYTIPMYCDIYSSIKQL